MKNVTIAHTNILQTMLAQFHALCLGYHKTQSEQYTIHTSVSYRDRNITKAKKCKLYYNEKWESKDLVGHFGRLSENYN